MSQEISPEAIIGTVKKLRTKADAITDDLIDGLVKEIVESKKTIESLKAEITELKK